MTDQELEQRLHEHYRAMDPAAAPRGLGVRIDDAMERRTGRWQLPAFARPALATVLAAGLVVAVALGLRPGGFLSTTGASPTASAVAGSPAPSASASAGASGSPAATEPGGTVPPISTGPWATIDLQVVPDGPDQATSVVAWSGGYLALGTTATDASPVPAWVSRDGRSWTRLPAETFGTASAAVGAPTPGGLLVLTVAADGTTTGWQSTDGLAWTSQGPAPQITAPRDRDIAGSATGVVMVTGTPTGVAFSADGTSWETAPIPGDASTTVQGVAAFGSGFVAVGDSGAAGGSPVAWWSPDGVHWTSADVQRHPGDGFRDVHAAGGGLVATSLTSQTPGLASFWTSSDGRSWSVSDADPLGTWQQGEGAGSANGLFIGDGNRLLGYGIRADGQPMEYWTSLDGTRWTKLTLTGDTAPMTVLAVTPFLMRDGVLFAGDQQAWFGSPVR